MPLKTRGFKKSELKTPLIKHLFTVFTEKKFVAQKNGRIGDYAQARYTTTKEAGEIRNLCVHPKERSKGIEEMLITAATDEIQKVGTKKVFLIGPSERAELLAITNRLGFKKEFVVEGMVWKTK